MLRNFGPADLAVPVFALLNEVLSLNAQELNSIYDVLVYFVVLNEVLSLNAQE